MKLTAESVILGCILISYVFACAAWPVDGYAFLVATILWVVLIVLVSKRDRRAVAAFRGRDVTADPPIAQPLHYAGYRPLTWSPSESKLGIPQFRLIENANPVATLWLEPQGRFVEAQTQEGRWVGSYEHSCLRISLPPPHTGVALLHCRWKYRLECPDSRVFRIKRGSVVEDEAGNQIIRFDCSHCQCFIEPTAAGLPDLTLVILMSVYVMIYETVFNTND